MFSTYTSKYYQNFIRSTLTYLSKFSEVSIYSSLKFNMKIITQLLLFSLTLCLSSVFLSADSSKVLTLKGTKGPGQGKTVVLVSGDEEYRTEESMPMLAKILSQKHGFTCKVLFAWDKTEEYIDPNNQNGVIGWNHLKDADLMIIGTRFRDPSADDAKHITRFLNLNT